MTNRGIERQGEDLVLRGQKTRQKGLNMGSFMNGRHRVHGGDVGGIDEAAWRVVDGVLFFKLRMAAKI